MCYNVTILYWHYCVSLAFQNNDFHILGVFTVLSVLHGGNGLPFLAKPVFDYLTTGCYSAIIVPDTEIPEIPLRFLIKKVDIYVAM